MKAEKVSRLITATYAIVCQSSPLSWNPRSMKPEITVRRR